MIEHSFIFIPGIGEKTEQRLWAAGILTWPELRNNLQAIGSKAQIAEDYLSRASSALSQQRATFFAEHLPKREYWRIYEGFQSKTVFLDIETTGLSLYYDQITLVGAFDGDEVKIFLKGSNLEDLLPHLRRYEIIVTFNGSLFDIPFIMKTFPGAQIR